MLSVLCFGFAAQFILLCQILHSLCGSQQSNVKAIKMSLSYFWICEFLLVLRPIFVAKCQVICLKSHGYIFTSFILITTHYDDVPQCHVTHDKSLLLTIFALCIFYAFYLCRIWRVTHPVTNRRASAPASCHWGWWGCRGSGRTRPLPGWHPGEARPEWWCPTTPCPCGSAWSCWPGERRQGQPHKTQNLSGTLAIMVLPHSVPSHPASVWNQDGR